MSYSLGLGAGACLGAAWLWPGTLAAALLEWIAVAGMICCARGRLAPLYLGGVLTNVVGMSWLTAVVADFSEQGTGVSALLFCLYVAFSAFQLVLFAILFRFLPAFVDRIGCRAALAWIVSELLWDDMKMFPWRVGHPQIAFLPFAQIAEIGGVTAISLLMFWLCEAVARAAADRRDARLVVAPAVAVAIACLFGASRISRFEDVAPRQLDVALVQAREGEGAARMKRYQELTNEIRGPLDLVVWPQNVVGFRVHESIGDRKNDPRLPALERPASLLTGVHTYRPPVKRFRSALFIREDGQVPVPYHKRVLMPFGEYVPYRDVFPWLKSLSPSAVGWTRGDRAVVFEVPMRDGAPPARVSPQVCYEDVIPDVTRAGVAAGAELLVDLSDGAWAQDELPLAQHHQIARFRSIESRRTLLRSSGAGVTAVVSPAGRTVERLPFHVDGTIVARIPLSDARTIYASVGDLPWWILAVLCGLGMAGNLLFYGARLRAPIGCASSLPSSAEVSSSTSTIHRSSLREATRSLAPGEG